MTFKTKLFGRICALCMIFVMLLCISPISQVHAETPPPMPSGETPPNMPSGDTQGQTPPDMPSGDAQGEMPSGGMPGGQSSSDITYTALYEYSEDTTVADTEINSTGTDENAVLISGGNVVLNRINAKRTSSSSTGGDNASFYGVGAAILAKSGTAYIKNSTINTDAAGGAGAFAYADGTVYISDTIINTKQDTSGGIHAAGGGKLYAWNVTATTEGNSSAAIRSDRGGGTMRIDGGTYTSRGTGSPAIYCTADIAAANATLISENSEAICIEGLNSLRLYDCALTGAMHDDAQNDCTWTVIVYQSMSGDSEVGCGTFTMSGGSLTSSNGGLFYTTNTESEFILNNVNIISADDAEFFLRCTGNANQRGWGSTGSNGAECKFTAISQEMNGDIQWDSISTLDMFMTQSSRLTGAFVNDESCAGEGGTGYANLSIDSTSVWTVTGDSTLTKLSCAGKIQDENGKSVTVLGTDGTVLSQGESEYKITVSEYSEQAQSGASEMSAWTEYAEEMPALLASDTTVSGSGDVTALPAKTGASTLLWLATAVISFAIIALAVVLMRKKSVD